MKNKLKYFIIALIIMGSIPILPVFEDDFFGFFAFINFYGLSPFVLPLLISLPFIYKNKSFYFLYFSLSQSSTTTFLSSIFLKLWTTPSLQLYFLYLAWSCPFTY
ncbi:MULTISPECIES: hypothetical protein [Peptoniphilus]|uniref:hypothetical protein n=1 Tax=Peptoniphilus TaxID=162289 RepID=UPI000289A43F|nr:MULTISPECIES: hypothetical protein [Peptoniphilus]MDU2115732.1 hypothetical protein [Peptoniphilus lacydonensis]MDU5594767.1 hypothetical protein [Peptoniphilus rhinitidis]